MTSKSEEEDGALFADHLERPRGGPRRSPITVGGGRQSGAYDILGRISRCPASRSRLGHTAVSYLREVRLSMGLRQRQACRIRPVSSLCMAERLAFELQVMEQMASPTYSWWSGITSLCPQSKAFPVGPGRGSAAAPWC